MQWRTLFSCLHGLISLAILGIFVLSGCSAARSVRPLGAGNAAAGVSLGGPIFTNLGPPIPVPLIAVFGRYGLGEDTDLDVGVHMPIARAVGVDVGAAHLFLRPAGAVPAVMAGARLSLFGNGKTLTGSIDPDTHQVYRLDAHLFEEIYATASWQFDKWLTYGGLDLFGQVEHALVRPSLYVGTHWRPLERLGFSAEVKWMAFLTDQNSLAVNWRGVGGYGVWALQVGTTYYFGPGSSS